jgi:anti-anti-sigma factor
LAANDSGGIQTQETLTPVVFVGHHNLSETLPSNNLFADITPKPGLGVLFVHLIGPTIGQRETPIILQMVSPAITEMGTSLKHVVFDMSAVTYMNSVALGMCIDVRNRAAAVKADVVITGLSAEIKYLFELVKFDRLFKIVKNTEELSKAIGA